jgi:hypothetical protein
MFPGRCSPQIRHTGPHAEGDIFMSTNKENEIRPDVRPVSHNQGCKLRIFSRSFGRSARFLWSPVGPRLMYLKLITCLHICLLTEVIKISSRYYFMNIKIWATIIKFKNWFFYRIVKVLLVEMAVIIPFPATSKLDQSPTQSVLGVRRSEPEAHRSPPNKSQVAYV